jgi:putative transposase
MGKVASSVGNALIESFWSSMQSELLDRQSWTSQVELTSAMFEWIEGWCNARRRHSSLGMVSPASFQQLDNNLPVVA